VTLKPSQVRGRATRRPPRGEPSERVVEERRTQREPGEQAFHAEHQHPGKEPAGGGERGRPNSAAAPVSTRGSAHEGKTEENVMPAAPGDGTTRAAEERDQRQHEEDRSAAAMDGAVDHVRPHVYAEQADREDAEPVADDPERDDEGHEQDASPGALQEQMGGEHARDEERPARADAAALAGHLEDDARQLEDGAVAHERRAGHREEQRRHLRRGARRGHLEPVHGGVGNGTMKMRKPIGNAAAPSAGAKEEEAAGGDERDVGEGREGEVIVEAERGAPRDGGRKGAKRHGSGQRRADD